MVWSQSELKQHLTEWGVKSDMAEQLSIYYMDGKTIQYQEGVCLTVDALQKYCTDEGRKAYIIPRLPELMRIENRVNNIFFFEVLSAAAFTPLQRAQICEDMAHIAVLTNSNSNYEKALKNMTGSGPFILFEYEKTTEKICTVMAKKLNHLKNFLYSVRNYDDYINCKKIQLTGSDSHMNNKQVLIITGSDDKKIVYKPHSVWAEVLVNETIKLFNQYFDEHSHLGFQDLHLPVLEAKTFRTPGGTFYGEIGFVEKAKQMSCDEAKRYYRKMGVLAFISKLLGLADLNQENIMATKDGPIILDAECILNPGILGDCTFSNTCMDMALRCETGSEGECADAAFEIVEGSSTKASVKEYPKYRDELYAGFSLGEMAFQEIYTSVIDLIGKWDKTEPDLEDDPKKMRWVPFATAVLMEYSLMCVHDCDQWKGKAETEGYRKICDLSKGAVITQWDAVCVKLKDTMEKSFLNGDIPYFSIAVTEREATVFCDDTEICSFDTLNKEKWKQLICENGRQILSGGWHWYKKGLLEILSP